MKSDFGIWWIQSGQWITFQSEGEKFGPHMDNCSRSYFISAWFNRCGVGSSSKDLSYTLFQQLLDRVFGRIYSNVW